MHRLSRLHRHIFPLSTSSSTLTSPLSTSSSSSSSPPPAVRRETNGHVTTIILSRPSSRNAVDGPTAALLVKALSEFEADNSARVAVLWGEGGNFCAGADLKAMGTERMNNVSSEGTNAPMGPSRMLLSKPVIAAVSGFAVAGGLELACWCDLRVAEEDSIFGVFCRRWGVPLIDGGTVRLPLLIGLSRALDLILTGRAISAREAKEMGLVNRIVEKGQARRAAEELAREIAAFPQLCMKRDRESAYSSSGKILEQALKEELEKGHSVLSEALEGAKKFAGGEGRHGKF